MVDNKKYLDLEGLSHYSEKVKETFLAQDHNLTQEEIDTLFENFDGSLSVIEGYELKVENGEIILTSKETSQRYKLAIEEEKDRIISLSSQTKIAPEAILIETIGAPEYVEEKDLASYSDYNLTTPGWYVFARIKSKKGISITNGFSIEGVEGYKTPAVGATSVDVAVKFDVLAESQLVAINWGESTETFLFKSTDLATRNLDYRVTFYLYNIDDYTTWEYKLTTDSTFTDNQKYYTKNGSEYILAEVTTGESIPENTYYIHSGITFKDFVKNVSYCCDYIDCPVTIYLPEVDDENYGAWFEVQTQFDAARSITIIPSANTRVSGNGVQTPKAGINIINFQFHKPTRTWLPTITNWALSSN